MAEAARHRLSAEEEGWVAKAWRFEREGWTFLHLEGGPYERGFQHGWLLAAELAEVLRVNRFLTLWQTGNDFDWFSRMAVQMYGHKVEAEFIEEMHGIAAGAKRAGVATSFAEILAWNANLEMIGSWWPLVAESRPVLNLTQHRCSAFIATGKGWTKDGRIVMGHNTWDTYANGAHSSIVMEIVPTNGFGILMQSAPGLIHSGTDFFQLGSGIIGCETSFAGFNKYDDQKTPEFARVRQAMQYAVDLDHWMQIMRTDNNGGYANSWLLGDTGSGEIVRFELGLAYEGVERSSDGYFWGCNIINDLKIRNQEAVNVGYDDISQDAGRRVRWNQLIREQQGRIDADAAQAMLADHWDVLNRRDQPCNRSICGHFDQDPAPFSSWNFPPSFPFGAVDGKVTTSAMAEAGCFLGRFGHPCGQPFAAAGFLAEQPQFDWLKGYLQDMPTRAWATFQAGERPPHG